MSRPVPKQQLRIGILCKIRQPIPANKGMGVLSHMGTQKYCTTAGQTVFSGSCAALLTELSRHFNLLASVIQTKVMAGQAPDLETEVESQHRQVSARSGICMGWLPAKHACQQHMPASVYTRVHITIVCAHYNCVCTIQLCVYTLQLFVCALKLCMYITVVCECRRVGDL